jgi:hypothetical protein
MSKIEINSLHIIIELITEKLSLDILNLNLKSSDKRLKLRINNYSTRQKSQTSRFEPLSGEAEKST